MNKYNQVLIISGGSCQLDLIRKLIEKKKIDTVIAVDGGLRIADELKLTPDYIVGDFDTIAPEIIANYRELANAEGKPQILSFCPEKNDTDTEIAIRLCVDLKVDEVTIVGATGTRLDHTFANLHLLKKFLDAGIKAAIYDENNKIYLINQNFKLLKREQYGDFFSMLPFTEKVLGITLKGFKYPLQDKDIEFGTSLCVSNEIVEDVAEVELRQGILVLFESRD